MAVEMLSYNQLGERLGCSPEAARALVKRLRLPRQKANDGKVLVSVDLSELNHKPMPARSPPRSKHASRYLRRIWSKSKPWQQVTGRTSNVSASVSTGSWQSYCGPPWIHNPRKKRPPGSMVSSQHSGPAHGGVGSFVGRTEHTPIHNPP
jgi:hypothetical protein